MRRKAQRAFSLLAIATIVALVGSEFAQASGSGRGRHRGGSHRGGSHHGGSCGQGGQSGGGGGTTPPASTFPGEVLADCEGDGEGGGGTSHWRPVGDLNIPRALAAGTRIGGNSPFSGMVVVTGGLSANGVLQQELEIYNPLDESWTHVTGIEGLSGNFAHTLVWLGDVEEVQDDGSIALATDLLSVGGSGVAGEGVAFAFAFRLRMGPAGPQAVLQGQSYFLAAPRAYAASVLVPGTRSLHVIGGEEGFATDGSGNLIDVPGSREVIQDLDIDVASILDPSYLEAGTPPVHLSFFGAVAEPMDAGILIADTHGFQPAAYLVGGEALDVVTATIPLLAQHVGGSAARIDGTRLMVTGTLDGDTEVVDVPGGEAYLLGVEPTEAPRRVNPLLVSLGGGKVLLVGGADADNMGDGPTTSVQLYEEIPGTGGGGPLPPPTPVLSVTAQGDALSCGGLFTLDGSASEGSTDRAVSHRFAVTSPTRAVTTYDAPMVAVRMTEGTWSVKLTVFDGCAYAETTTTVTVHDGTPPAIDVSRCGSRTIKMGIDSCCRLEAKMPEVPARATDDCDSRPSLSQSPAECARVTAVAGTSVPVTLRSRDDAGNEATAVVNYTVRSDDGRVSSSCFRIGDCRGGKTGSFDVRVLEGQTFPTGSFTFRDLRTCQRLDATAFTGLGIECGEAVFTGTGLWNGTTNVRFRVCVEDRGNCRRDKLRVWVESAASGTQLYDSGSDTELDEGRVTVCD